MIDFIVKGGPVMWPIIGFSIVACIIIIERLLYLHRISVDEQKLFTHVKNSLLEGHYNEALAICDQNISPFSTLLKIGIENRHQPESIQRDILKDAAALEAPKLERGLSLLSTITSIEPLMGLLGTVTGTMRAFGVLGTFGAVSDPTALASGVSEALITTVAGLIVAIPCTVFYNYFVDRINRTLLTLESQVNSLVLLINSTVNGKEKTGGGEEA